MVEYDKFDGSDIDVKPPEALESTIDDFSKEAKDEILSTYSLGKPVTTIGINPLRKDSNEILARALEEWFFVYPVVYNGEREVTLRITDEGMESETVEEPMESIIISRFKNAARLQHDIEDSNINDTQRVFSINDGSVYHDLQGLLLWPDNAADSEREMLIDIAEFTNEHSEEDFK